MSNKLMTKFKTKKSEKSKGKLKIKYFLYLCVNSMTCYKFKIMKSRKTMT